MCHRLERPHFCPPPVDLDYWYGRGWRFSAYPLDEDYAPPAVFPSDEAELYYNEGYRDAQWRDMQPEF